MMSIACRRRRWSIDGRSISRRRQLSTFPQTIGNCMELWSSIPTWRRRQWSGRKCHVCWFRLYAHSYVSVSVYPLCDLNCCCCCCCCCCWKLAQRTAPPKCRERGSQTRRPEGSSSDNKSHSRSTSPRSKAQEKTKTKIISTIISSSGGYEEERRLKTTTKTKSRKPQAKTMFLPFVEPAARLYDQDLSQMWTE